MSESNTSSIVDGKYIIGRVVGQFFVPGGTSRNGRFYPESLWEKVLKSSEVQERLSERKMFGTIGHDEEPVSESQLRNGEVSHIISKLWIDVDDSGKKLGMGEALILGTQSGINLNIYLRSGVGLNTSSRASGRFLEGKENNGVPVVDEDSYIFETFDFVQDPGFLAAKPELVENFNQSNKEQLNMNEDIISTSLKAIMESRDAVRLQLDEALHEKAVVEKKLNDIAVKFEKLSKYEDVLPAMESVIGDVKNVEKISISCKSLGFSNVGDLLEAFLTRYSTRQIDAQFVIPGPRQSISRIR
jgi:hypothetical protein